MKKIVPCERVHKAEKVKRFLKIADTLLARDYKGPAGYFFNGVLEIYESDTDSKSDK